MVSIPGVLLLPVGEISRLDIINFSRHILQLLIVSKHAQNLCGTMNHKRMCLRHKEDPHILSTNPFDANKKQLRIFLETETNR